MAQQTNELYSRQTQTPEPRIQPAEGPGSVAVKQFASGSGTLAVGTPVAVTSAGLVTKIVPAGTAHASTTPIHIEAIYGIVYPEAVTLNASGEVHGKIMLKGSAHREDIETAMGGASANLLLCLRNPIVRYRGLHIDGLTLAS